MKTYILIEVDGEEIKLPADQLRDIRDALDAILDKGDVREVVRVVRHEYVKPWWSDPWWEAPKRWGDTWTCGGSTSASGDTYTLMNGNAQD